MVIFLAGQLGSLGDLPAGSLNRLIQAGQIYVGRGFGMEFIIGDWWQSHGDGSITAC
jgi:hypothetical protein